MQYKVPFFLVPYLGPLYLLSGSKLKKSSTTFKSPRVITCRLSFHNLNDIWFLEPLLVTPYLDVSFCKVSVDTFLTFRVLVTMFLCMIWKLKQEFV